MTQQRDAVIEATENYQGFTWDSLGLDHLHFVCREAIANCCRVNKQLWQRFNKLQGPTPAREFEEKNWLTSLLETWFMKKWNTKRGADMKKEEYARKRKRAALCECGREKVCPDCDDVENNVKVFI
jgi:hypothetical protein